MVVSRLKKRDGFLIGILITFALLGILVAIASRNYSVVLTDSEIAHVKADMRTIADAANKYRADMGPGSISNLAGTGWCSALTSSTTTSPDGLPVGPWLGTCPKPQHVGGSFSVTALTDYTADVTYTYSSGTLKLSDLAKPST